QLKGRCLVTEFLVGRYAVLERLSAWNLGRELLRIFRRNKRFGGYRIPWDKLDLSNPEAPRLRCSVRELKTLQRQVEQ
ncbi:MAG TPA: hypothetical protein VJ180_11180, partial [Pyrinomonadaceae bacterium]|nr:hypothetical protein [Pyrinomonadaceae bacterium]